MWCETCEKPVPYGSELHYLAKEHVKQALNNLRGVCFACSTELHTPTAVKLHLKQKKHLNKVKRGCHLPWPVVKGWSCGLCAVHFSKQLGWEVHLASSLHQDSLSGDSLTNLPRVEALVEHLSPVPTRPSTFEFQPMCNLCDESCEGLDDFVCHLLSKEHVQQLKQCMCPGCKKYFNVIELASHLRSQTHLNVLLKSRTGDGAHGNGSQDQLGNRPGSLSDDIQLRVYGTNSEGTSDADVKNHLWFSGAYETPNSSGLQGWWNCSYCLIACRSWHGFAVHIRDNFHADNLPKRWTVQMQHGATKYLTYDSRMIACCRTPLQFRAMPSCSLPAATAWQRWKKQRDLHSGWCHSCGIILSTPHLVEQHLVSHVSKKMHKRSCGTIMSTEGVCLGEEGQEYAEIFECRSCSVSFCSDLGLTIHIALQQHQLRCNNLENSGGGWCESCGVTVLHHGVLDTTIEPDQQDANCLGEESTPVSNRERPEAFENGVEVDVAASPQETCLQRFSSDCHEISLGVNTSVNPELQLSLLSRFGYDNSNEASPCKSRAPKAHEAGISQLVEGDGQPDSLISHETSEAPAQSGPKDSLQDSHCQSGTVDGFSAHCMVGRTCGDSFCTRGDCCEVQPLLIEIPTSPGEDTGDTASVPCASPSSIAKRMLLSLADGEERLGPVVVKGHHVATLQRFTPPMYETRDFLRASYTESAVRPNEAVGEENRNEDGCLLSLSFSLPSKSMEPDLQTSERSAKLMWISSSNKRPGGDGSCVEFEFQESKHIKFSE